LRIEWLPSVDSTNAEARRRAVAGECGPLWIAAETQTAGRGRRGRSWSGFAGNLFATGLYVIDNDPARAAQLSFAAALAVAEVCERVVARERVRVKWPNDVLIDGRKVSGILLESGTNAHGQLWLAVGIGINLAAHPDDAERPATSLKAHGADVTPVDTLPQLVSAFEHWLAIWKSQGFAGLRDAWITRAFGIGERCSARLENETVTGVFTDLAADGSLRLDLPDGRRRLISAGDVFFPGPVR
tara:strand:+ start:352 stop:1080 length:729 start_codon:yes stop_codon:yes gene_type:complete